MNCRTSIVRALPEPLESQHLVWRRHVEDEIRSSGLDYTIILFVTTPVILGLLLGLVIAWGGSARAGAVIGLPLTKGFDEAGWTRATTELVNKYKNKTADFMNTAALAICMGGVGDPEHSVPKEFQIQLQRATSSSH